MSKSLIPQAFRDELLQRTDIVELIDSYVPLKKRGNSYLSCCPFHNEKTPSFNVIPRKQFYHCFGCGVNGNAISFVMSHLNLNFIEAVETLADRLGLQVPRHGPREKKEDTVNHYQLLEKVNSYYQHTLKTAGSHAVTYLKQRGLTGEIAKKFQIGYAPSGWNNLEKHFRKNKNELIQTGMLIKKDDGKTCDRYRDRIMFPIHDRRGRIIGFGGRALQADQKPKYLNSPETTLFQKSRELYGLHHVAAQKSMPTEILIVEGYLDVIALAQYGIDNAVAALGTATSTWHIQVLSQYTRQIIFCFDGDEAGRKAAWKALESSLSHLEKGLAVSFMFLPDAHDPDSLIRAEGTEHFRSLMQKAIPLNQYLLDNLSEDKNTQTVSGKSQLLNAAAPFLHKMPEGSYKQILIDELARLTRIENHRVVQIISGKQVLPAPENNPQTEITRSPVRIAIALLIQNPEIFTVCSPQITIGALDGRGQEILQKLLIQVSGNSNHKTSTLIELWRETPYFESLTKLAAWDHQVPEEALTAEFVEIIHFLQKQNFEKKIDEYIAKSRKQGLTTSEQVFLQNMLIERQRMISEKS